MKIYRFGDGLTYEQINKVAKKLFWKNRGRGYDVGMSKIRAAIVKGWLLERYGHVKVYRIDNTCKTCEGAGRVPFGGWENGEISDNVCLDCMGSGMKNRSENDTCQN